MKRPPSYPSPADQQLRKTQRISGPYPPTPVGGLAALTPTAHGGGGGHPAAAEDAPLRQWLHSISSDGSLVEFAPMLEQAIIRLDTLHMMEDEDFKRIGLPYGPRIAIRRAARAREAERAKGKEPPVVSRGGAAGMAAR
jgi:hypothetical protein